ncbi:MAG: hypothetical protein RL033_469 [Pseudomonadota bacterium]|jgi:hypothetical protein
MIATPPGAWSLDQLRFPKQLDDDSRSEPLRARLRASRRKLWEGGVLEVPVVSWSDRLATALSNAERSGHLLQGIEHAERELEKEAKGLSMADARSSIERGSRVSRLLLTSNDGSERFSRQVERLLRTHGARVLALQLDATSTQLAAVRGESGSFARALLVEHKTSVASVLLALCEEPGS